MFRGLGESEDKMGSGCPAIQLNFDTTLLEVAPDCTWEGLSPTKLLPAPPPLQMPVASPGCSLYFSQTDYRLGLNYFARMPQRTLFTRLLVYYKSI